MFFNKFKREGSILELKLVSGIFYNLLINREYIISNKFWKRKKVNKFKWDGRVVFFVILCLNRRYIIRI